MDSLDIKARIHKRLLDLRNIERLIALPSFITAYDRATEKQQFEIFLAVDEEDADKLRLILRTVMKNEMTLRELRDRARELAVRQYSRLDKNELLIAIQSKESKNGLS